MPPATGTTADMSVLIRQLHTIVGGRDRTHLNGALLQGIQALFNPKRASLSRVVTHNGITFFIPCGTLTGETLELRDAYLLSPQHGHLLAGHELYLQCVGTGQRIHIPGNAGHHYVHPLRQHDRVYALLELERATPLTTEEQTLLDQFTQLVMDHLALLDYAETDTLTGLLNRKTFDENLNRVLASAGNDDALVEEAALPHRRHAKQSDVANWLAVSDIDHFKRINDSHGHIIGDEVLLLVAQCMRQSFRFDDQLFRFGGEEFVTVLQPTTHADALAVLERFRQNIANTEFPLVGHITISIGFTRISPLDTPTELVGRADQALYYAKQHGRNRVANYETLHASGLIADVLTDKPKAELF